jgi:hypothetical protein
VRPPLLPTAAHSIISDRAAVLLDSTAVGCPSTALSAATGHAGAVP